MDDVDVADAQSRRRFLTGAAGAAVGVGVLGVAAQPAAARPSRRRKEAAPDRARPAHRHFRRDLFENAPKGRMVVRLADGPVTLEIDSIEPLGVAEDARSGSALWRDAFSVKLSGPKGTDIPQGTHRVSIGARRFDLFIVPVLSRGAGRRYEAIINRAHYRRVHA